MERALLWITSDGSVRTPSVGTDRPIAFAIQPLESWFAREDPDAWKSGLQDASVFARGVLSSSIRRSILELACPAHWNCISLDALAERHQNILRVSRAGHFGWDWSQARDWNGDCGAFHDIGVDDLSYEDEVRIWSEWILATQSVASFSIAPTFSCGSFELTPAYGDGANTVFLFTPTGAQYPQLPARVGQSTGMQYLTCTLSSQELDQIVKGTFTRWGDI